LFEVEIQFALICIHPNHGIGTPQIPKEAIPNLLQTWPNLHVFAMEAAYEYLLQHFPPNRI